MNNESLDEMAEMLLERARIKINLKDGSKVLATADVYLGSLIQIRGWTIQESQFDDNPLFIQPPRYIMQSKKAFFYFYCSSDRLYHNLVERIREEYKKKEENKNIKESIDDLGF